MKDLVLLRNVLNGTLSEQEFIKKHNIRIYLDGLPDKVNGYVFIYRDIYNIHINKKLSKDKRIETLIHEYAHVERNMLRIEPVEYGFVCSIKGIEDSADKYLEMIKKI